MAKIDFNTKKLSGTIHDKLSVFVRKIALDGLRQLIRQSPVDTGRFKANWSTAAGMVGSAMVDAPARKTKRGCASAPEDMQRSAGAISTYDLNENLYLYNNMTYAMALEYGSSLQAPSGWMRNTADLMQKKLIEVRNIL